MKYKKKKNGFYVALAVLLIATGSIIRLGINTSLKTDKKVKSNLSSSSITSSIKAPEKPIIKEESNPTSVSKVVSSSPIKAKEKKPVAAKAIVYTMPLKGNISKDFSDKKLVYSKTYGDIRAHLGIDILAEIGTTVCSAAEGTVTDICKDAFWGSTVEITHNGNIKTYYCGLKDVSVKKGDKIKSGKILGTVGTVTCESADQSHLHFAVKKDGKYVSPLSLMGN